MRYCLSLCRMNHWKIQGSKLIFTRKINFGLSYFHYNLRYCMVYTVTELKALIDCMKKIKTE